MPSFFDKPAWRVEGQPRFFFFFYFKARNSLIKWGAISVSRKILFHVVSLLSIK